MDTRLPPFGSPYLEASASRGYALANPGEHPPAKVRPARIDLILALGGGWGEGGHLDWARATLNPVEDSAHFVAMLRERGILRQWTDLAVREPEWSEERADGTRHFARRIPEHGNRWLRVIVNLEAEPPLRVTAFSIEG